MSTSNNGINNQIGTSANNTIAQHIRAAAGQWDNFNDQTDAHGYYSGVGSPEGVVAADIGSTYSDTGAGATGIYYKTTDTVNTGWVLIPSVTAGTSFLAHLAATTVNVTGAGATYTLVGLTEQFDQGGDFNPATGTFTAPADGIYFLGCSIYTTGNTVATQFTSSIVTTTQTFTNRVTRAASALDYSVPCEALTFMNAGDTATFTIFVSGEAGNTSDVFGQAASPRFTYVYGQLVSSSVLSGAFSVVSQTFTANGTYTPTPGLQYCQVEMVGGGAAGGGSVVNAAGQFNIGAGGGAGEYAYGVFSAATIGVSQAVTIGAAGVGAAGAGGGNGGNTSLGALISAFGGLGGGVGVAAINTSSLGGVGGTGGAGGSFRYNGQTAPLSAASVTLGLQLKWAGANGPFGAGGGETVGTGAAATGFGAGGAGRGNTVVPGVATAGGAGSAGLIKITEYVIV